MTGGRALRRVAVDLLMTAACLAAAGLFLRAFFSDLNATTLKRNEKPLGYVAYKERSAMRRLGGRAVWENLDTRSPVYDLDAIRTDSGSQALIVLEDGTELGLQENSLVILSFAEGARNIDFVSGSLVAKGGEGAAAGALTIRSGGSALKVGAASVDLKKGGKGDLSVAVDKGSVELRSASGAVRSVTQSEEARIEGNSITTSVIPVSLLSPAGGSVLTAFTAKPAVSFSWTRNETAGSLVLELSRRRDFSAVELSLETEAGSESASLPLGAGSWWWRLRPKPVAGAAGVASAQAAEPRSSQFTLLSEDAVSALGPEDGARFTYRSDGPQVRLAWKGADRALECRWSLAADESFTTMIASGTVAGAAGGASAQTAALGAGTYYWKVEPRYAGPVLGSGASLARSFVVVRAERPVPTEALAPGDGKTALLSELERDGLALSWRPSDEAASYRLEIARDKAFTRPARDLSLSEPSYRLGPDLEPGLYWWRASVVDREGVASLPSAPRSLEVAPEDRNVALEAPADGYVFARDSSGRQLSWRAPEGSSVLVRVFRAGEGEPFLEKTVMARSLLLPALAPGSYRWSVAPAAAPQRAADRSFSVAEPPAPPATGKPSSSERVSLVNRRDLEFSWSPVAGAETYRFELFGPDGSSKARAEVADPRLVLPDAGSLPLGAYSWTLAAVRKASELSETLSGPPARFSFRLDSVREVGPALPRLPADGAILAGLAARRNGLSFAWKRAEAKARTTFVLARDRDFAEVLRNVEGTGESLSVASPGPGTYFWKLASRTADGSPLPDSGVFAFTIAPIPLLPAPSILAPAPGASIDMKRADSILFRWSKVEGATHYELALYLAKGGKQVWTMPRATGTELRFTALDALDLGGFVLSVKPISIDRSGAVEQDGKAATLRFSVDLSSAPSLQPVLTTPGTVYVP